MENNKSRVKAFLPAIIILAIAGAWMLGVWVGRKQAVGYLKGQIGTLVAGDKMSAILSLIKNKYVDSVALDSLTEELIPELLRQLDPHSVYIKAQEFAAANEPLDGEFEGIGVMFNMLTDTISVINVITGGPSDKAGMLAGDKIMTIDGKNFAGVQMNQDSVVSHLRGKKGSEVALGVKRHGVKNLLTIKVIRGTVPYKSIDAAYLVDPKTAYVKMTRFSRNTHQELMDLVLPMKKQEGITTLILDLRGNSGGFLDQAINIANEFLDDNQLIVYTQGIHSEKMEQLSNGKGRLKDLNVKLLIDEWSASASEIVAGALQDNDKGTIYGRRSFGKGLVQEQIPFTDGSAMRLTIARYYTPLGRSIQKPYVHGLDDYNMDILKRYASSELFSKDSIKIDDTTKFVTAKGKELYGGGGVIPDVFVPIDTISGNFMRAIVKGNVLVYYAYNYTDIHREELNKLNSFKLLDAYFDRQDNAIMRDFIQYAAEKGVKGSQTEIADSQDLLKWQLRAYIARNTPLDDNAFYHYFMHIDNVITEARK